MEDKGEQLGRAVGGPFLSSALIVIGLNRHYTLHYSNPCSLLQKSSNGELGCGGEDVASEELTEAAVSGVLLGALAGKLGNE